MILKNHGVEREERTFGVGQIPTKRKRKKRRQRITKTVRSDMHEQLVRAITAEHSGLRTQALQQFFKRHPVKELDDLTKKELAGYFATNSHKLLTGRGIVLKRAVEDSETRSAIYGVLRNNELSDSLLRHRACQASHKLLAMDPQARFV